jgi:hypothetical protein
MSVNPVDAETHPVMNLYPPKRLSSLINPKMMMKNILRIFYDYIEKRSGKLMSISTVSLRSKLLQSNRPDCAPVTLHKPKVNLIPKIIKIIAKQSVLIKSKSIKNLPLKSLIRNLNMIRKNLKS